MTLFFWKKNAMIDSFASKLADDFFSRTQPDAVDTYFASSGMQSAASGGGAGKKALSGKPDAKRQQMERTIHDVALKLAQYKTREGLGIYGKARLHMSLMGRLSELGFSKPAVQELNRILLLKSP